MKYSTKKIVLFQMKISAHKYWNNIILAAMMLSYVSILFKINIRCWDVQSTGYFNQMN